MSFRTAAVSLTLALGLASPPARGQEPEIPPSVSELPPAPPASFPAGLLPADWEDPGSYQSLALRGSLLLAARGYEGLALLHVADTQRRRLLAVVGQGLDIQGVRWVGRNPLARTSRGEVILLDVQDPQFPRTLLLVAPGSVEAEGALRSSRGDVPLPAAPVAGQVIELRQGSVIIDRGAEAGLAPGMHLLVTSARSVEVFDLGTQETYSRPSGEELSVVRIEEVSDTRARALLGPGDDARIGDRAQSSDRGISADLLRPRRVGDALSIAGNLRPFVGVNTLAFGAISDFELAWRAHAPLRLALALDPVAMVAGREGAGLPGNALVSAMLDEHLFGVGVGLGYCWSLAAQTGPAFRQILRLGAEDGLSLVGHNEFILALPTDKDFEGTPRHEADFVWGGAKAHLRGMTGRRTRLGLEGGGSVNGHAFGSLTLDIALKGHGGPGTTWLMVGGGFGCIWDNPAEHSMTQPLSSDAEYSATLSPPQVGPLFSLGVEKLVALGP